MLPLRSVFNDAASLILRAMLADPKRKWVVRDFVDEFQLGQGWVASVLTVLRTKGFIQGVGRGRLAGASMNDPAELIREWTRHYDIEQNKMKVFYSEDPHILLKVKKFFKEKGQSASYALTLNSGANLLTSYVKDPNIYFYLKTDKPKQFLFEMRMALGLKELKEGGNVYVITPYYKRSVFFEIQNIKGFPVVSNLQLYLDLFHFSVRGHEHAEYLLKSLKREGKNFV